MADSTNSRTARRKQAKQKKSGKKKYSTLKKILLGLLGLIAVLAIITLITFTIWIKDAPDLNEQRLIDPVASQVLDKNSEVYATLGVQKRDYVQYEDIPKDVEAALLATEDKRFYKHHGIDIIRLGGAVMGNITGGFGSQGASTITQQVVKLSFLSPDKTMKRKVQEMYLAVQLEQEYSKEEILEIYFNKVNMSEGVYGIGTAATVYFGKTLDQLTLPETALLVGMPQSPNNYNPYDHPDAANERKNTVLKLMYDSDVITEKEMKEAQAVDISTVLVPRSEGPATTNHATSAIVDQVINEVEDAGDFDVYSDGLTIHTTIDPEAQRIVEETLESNPAVPFPNDQMQTGTVLMDTQTGEVRALGGWRKTTVERGFNYATDLTNRQPGSTIKPILDYGPAIEYEGWSTYEQIVDEPYEYSDGTKVSNSNNKYAGKVSMRTALTKSMNVPAVKTLQEVGIEPAAEFAAGLGIELDDQMFESAAIGGVNNGPSPLELAGAYGAFGNGGTFTEPYTVKKIETMDGSTIDTIPESKKAMEPSTAYMLTDMLEDVVDYGTGTKGNIPSLPLAGKTGTTNYTAEEKEKYGIKDNGVPDSWYVGYTPTYTMSVWVGYGDRKQSVDSASQKLPATIFKTVMTQVSANIDTPDFKKPDNVVELPILIGSDPAAIAAEGTPDGNITYELFTKDNLPTKKSEEFVKPVEISGLSASYSEANKQIDIDWDYPAPEGSAQADNEFSVDYSIDDGTVKHLGNTKETAARITNVEQGVKYTITVTSGDKKSTSSTSVTVPAKEPEKPDEVAPPVVPDENNETDGEAPTDGNNGNNGNNGDNGDNGNNGNNVDTDGDGIPDTEDEDTNPTGEDGTRAWDFLIYDAILPSSIWSRFDE